MTLASSVAPMAMTLLERSAIVRQLLILGALCWSACAAEAPPPVVTGPPPEPALPPAEIVEWCGSKLARYKVPRYIEYRSEFPRTPSMRVKKEDLKAERADLTAGCWDREQAMAGV